MYIYIYNINNNNDNNNNNNHIYANHYDVLCNKVSSFVFERGAPTEGAPNDPYDYFCKPTPTLEYAEVALSSLSITRGVQTGWQKNGLTWQTEALHFNGQRLGSLVSDERWVYRR